MSNVHLKITKKRGRAVVTPEVESKLTTKQMLDELAQLAAAQKELLSSKRRKSRQPQPVPVRKALDHMPVLAGERVDREARAQRREAKREEREARRAQREAIRQRRQLLKSQALDLRIALGAGFFAEDLAEKSSGLAVGVGDTVSAQQ
eukprot:CAMPEP_0171106396 /NCGR_PEP_ID=MMETSP0766_2-20121228/64658_1 /TAXON_ID=439317 /ORGANISM="Gambierdiscus australes, Strain CAWD 149" /LENGTH=147 /DNA_ID=CAMNT_0011567481 /DNA_START=119 /DNA_END=562 /DNA_ORIENTATION=+